MFNISTERNMVLFAVNDPEKLNLKEILVNIADRVLVLTANEHVGDYSALSSKLAVEALPHHPDDDLLTVRRHELAKDLNVIAMSEAAILRAARLRRRLGAPGHSFSHSLYFRDKLRTRQRLMELNVPGPKFQNITRASDIEYFRAKSKRCGIMKPRMGAGSNLVFKVPPDMPHADIDHRMGDHAGGWIVEEFIPGKIYHVDGYCIDRAFPFVSVSKYISSPYRYRSRRPGGSYLLQSGSGRTDEIAQFGLTMLRKLPAPKTFVFHLDVFEMPDGQLQAGEVAVRSAGNRIGDMIAAAGGPLMNAATLRAHAGLPPVPQAPLSCSGWASIRKPPAPLLVGQANSPFAWMRQLQLHPVRAGETGEASSSIDSIASFIAVGETSDQVRQRLAMGLKWLARDVFVAVAA